MGKFLNLAKDHIQKLDYEILEPIKDQKNCNLSYYAKYNNRTYMLLAFEKFHFMLGKGVCKSIDVELVDNAKKENYDFLIYTNEPIYKHEPECYVISPEKIDYWAKNNKVDIELFGKWDFCEKRRKYIDVPLSQLGMKNIRTDRSRLINKGERLWQPYLKPLEYIYIGDQHNDPIYKEIFGYTPDFANFNKKIILEEGKHSKEIEEKRKKLANNHGFQIFFIPHDYDFYKKHPEAINAILEVIEYL